MGCLTIKTALLIYVFGARVKWSWMNLFMSLWRLESENPQMETWNSFLALWRMRVPRTVHVQLTVTQKFEKYKARAWTISVFKWRAKVNFLKCDPGPFKKWIIWAMDEMKGVLRHGWHWLLRSGSYACVVAEQAFLFKKRASLTLSLTASATASHLNFSWRSRERT